MDENIVRRRWMGRVTFALVGLLLIFSNLIPLETVPPSLGGEDLLAIEAPALVGDETEPDPVTTPIRWIAPDLLLLLTLAWVARRPSFAPILVIAVLFFVADMLLQRPPGLWAGLVLILSELLRARARSMRSFPFMLEWATVSLGIFMMTLVYHFTLFVTVAQQGTLGLTLIQMGLTILAYPPVVLVANVVFGVRHPAPGEVIAMGHRL